MAEGAALDPALPDRLWRRVGLAPAFAHPRLAVLASPNCPCIEIAGEGVVIGTLFHRHGAARAIASLGETDARMIVQSGGGALLSSFWGGYVAALAAGDGVRVLRDPSAAIPCWTAQGPGWTAFTSDAELLVACGLSAGDVDWPALARYLHGAGLPAQETALCGIAELLPGFSVGTAEACMRQSPCWSPWDHVCAAADAAPAAERLARVAMQCVAAWSGVHGKLLVSVSGGLDSSIVAAGLSRARADAVCLTMFGEDPGGDERVHARALCERLGLPLLERSLDLDGIDISEPLGSHMPRPGDRTQALAYEHAHIAAAREIGAGAFMTGNGGDSVFGYSQSAAAIADRYLAEGLGWNVLATLRDVCWQTGCSLWQAARSAARLVSGPRGYEWRPDTLFLSPALVAALADRPLRHPWLDAPPHGLPGKAAHVASILRVLQCLEPGRSRHLPVLNPLLSQPLVETCLAIPSWEWRSGGRDRSLARRAFADMLPRSILDRRVKGGPDGFAARILDHYRTEIAERLLEGHLARQNLIDRSKLEGLLAGSRPVPGEHRVRILEFVAAEAWLDSWMSRGRRSGPAEASSANRP
ncbi:MAG: asparagine synthase-related protein [Allosphingosinicella sp.]|uniref:asparagine synthase-related protein n=1 Tax=Allosphingosinicella sp. TaxID=2823234 RepID=UPI00392FF94E